MCVISEPKCPQFWQKCPHAPRVPRAAFSSSATQTPLYFIFKCHFLGDISETQSILFSSNCDCNFERMKSLKSWELVIFLRIEWLHFFCCSKIVWSMQLPSTLVIGWLEENLNPKDWTCCLPKTIGSEEPISNAFPHTLQSRKVGNLLNIFQTWRMNTKSRPTIANPKTITINLIAVNTKDKINKYKTLYEVLNDIILYEI